MQFLNVPCTCPNPLSISCSAVQAVQGEEAHRWHQRNPPPGDPWRPHHPLPRPPDQGQWYSPHRPGHQQDYRFHQVWYWYVPHWSNCSSFKMKSQKWCVWYLKWQDFPPSAPSQVTCAWWPAVLTWGVSVWSPTGSVTLALLTWCTSRIAQATASPPGSPTSSSLARWGRVELFWSEHICEFTAAAKN